MAPNTMDHKYAWCMHRFLNDCGQFQGISLGFINETIIPLMLFEYEIVPNTPHLLSHIQCAIME